MHEYIWNLLCEDGYLPPDPTTFGRMLDFEKFPTGWQVQTEQGWLWAEYPFCRVHVWWPIQNTNV